MTKERVHIKNMVCNRCIAAVKHVLRELKIPFQEVILGEATLTTQLDEGTAFLLKDRLITEGFDLLEDKKARIVEKVKNLIGEMIDNYEKYKLLKLSDFLASSLGYDYSHISGTFAENQGVTIERFLILQKIERAKELLSYHEMNLNEIAERLHYSSSAALSTQFKDVTGMTPSDYKKLEHPGRKGLDEVG